MLKIIREANLDDVPMITRVHVDKSMTINNYTAFNGGYLLKPLDLFKRLCNYFCLCAYLRKTYYKILPEDYLASLSSEKRESA